MSEPSDLEARMSALEQRVQEVADDVRAARADASAVRHLAAASDRDSDDLRGEVRDFRRATTASFTAMRADFADLRTEVSDLREATFAGFTDMRGRLDGTAAGLHQITVLLNTLIERDAG